MMDVKRLNEIIMETTRQFRKGEAVVTEEKPGVTVTHVYAMPHTDAAPPTLELVDVWFINVGVAKQVAELRRDELVKILNRWPSEDGGRLTSGLSYITIGAVLGSQDLALMLLALGKVLGFWKVITPAIVDLKVGDPKGDELAEAGFVMAGGYAPEKVAA